MTQSTVTTQHLSIRKKKRQSQITSGTTVSKCITWTKETITKQFTVIIVQTTSRTTGAGIPRTRLVEQAQQRPTSTGVANYHTSNGPPPLMGGAESRKDAGCGK